MSVVWVAVRSRRFVLGTLGITAASGGLLGLAVVLPFVMRDFQVRPALAALVMPAAYFGCSLTSVLGGIAADRRGGARVSAAGLAVIALGILGASQADNVALYLVGAWLTGVGYGIVNPATSVMVDPGPARGRGVLLSVKQAGVTLGGVVGGLVLPVAAEHAGWPVALAGAAFLQLIIAAVMLVVADAPSVDARRRPAQPAGGFQLRPNPGSLYGLIMAGVQITAFGLLVVYLTEELGMSTVAGGAVFGAALSVAVVARIVWGAASDRRPSNRSRPLRACALLGIGGFMALAVPVPAFVGLGVILVGAGTAAWNGAYLAAVIASAETGQGAAVGRAVLFINIGCIAGPLIGSIVLTATNSWVVLWLVMAAAQAVGLVALTRATVVGDAALPQARR